MKRILSLAALGLTLAAVAEQKVLVELTLADQKTIVSQANSLGKIIDMPQLGMLASVGLASNPFAEELGTLRDGAVTKAVLTGDSDLLGTDAFTESLHFVVYYPTTTTKDLFLSADEDRQEKDGLIAFDGDSFVSFTADGKWAICGDDEATLRQMLPAVASIPAKQNEAVRLTVTEPGMEALAIGIKLLDKEMGRTIRRECGDLLDPLAYSLDVVSQMKGLSFGIAASKHGIDLASVIEARPGTELAKIGEKTLPADVLAPFGKETLIVCACAKNSTDGRFIEMIGKMIEVCKDHGFTFDFAKVTKKSRRAFLCSLDVKALVDYIRTEGIATAGKLDESFAEEMKKAVSIESKAKYDSPEMAFGFALKGHELPETPAERFAKVMPEAKGGAFSSVGVFSIYPTLKRLAGEVLANLPKGSHDIDEVAAIVKALPANDTACTVLVTEAKKDGRVKSLLRVSPEEVKGFMAAFAVISSAIDGGCIGDDDDDDDDDDDED